MCLVTLLAASCSHDDDAARAPATAKRSSSTTTLAPVDFAEWSAAVDQACADLNTTYATLSDTNPADADEAVAYADQVDEFADGILASVTSAGVPIGEEAQADALLDDLHDLSDATGKLASRAESGDADGVARAAARVAELGAAINPLSAELGVPSCGGF
ncbi:hypothetical protein BH10ACT3_BH10ACT3_19670 [soil metagenome]